MKKKDPGPIDVVDDWSWQDSGRLVRGLRPCVRARRGRGPSGTEEYQDSEKYQVRRWDVDRRGNLRPLIQRVNRIRRENAALHQNRTLRFYSDRERSDDCCGKKSAGSENVVLVAVNLDPHHAQSGWLTLPLDELPVDGSGSYQMHDLLSDGRYLWQGPRNYVRLDPGGDAGSHFPVA